MKKIILLLVISLMSINLYAQENIISTLTTGTDTNNDKAINKALRNAIEQTFGSFLVSKSTLVNDQLTSDEILTVSSGNIVSYEVISTITNPINKEITATISSKVSLVKLKSFIESKGIEVGFKGSLFAQNIMIQEFYEQNETKTLNELNALFKEYNDKCFDYSVEAKDPVKNGENWSIPLTVSAFINDNFTILQTNLLQSLKNISLSKEQADDYKKLGKEVFYIVIADCNNSANIFYLRKNESVQQLLNIVANYKNQIGSFEIDNSINKLSLFNSNWNITSNNFKPVLINLLAGFTFGGGANNTSARPVAAALFGLFDETNDIKKNYRELMYLNPEKDLSDAIKMKLSKFSSRITPLDCSFSTYDIDNLTKYGYGDYSEISSFFLGNDKKVYDLLKAGNKLEANNIIFLDYTELCKKGKMSTQFVFTDVKTLDEIKKIEKYKIYPKTIGSF